MNYKTVLLLVAIAAAVAVANAQKFKFDTVSTPVYTEPKQDEFEVHHKTQTVVFSIDKPRFRGDDVFTEFSGLSYENSGDVKDLGWQKQPDYNGAASLSFSVFALIAAMLALF